MVIIAPDGYIIDILGPYKATTNDATIMNNFFQSKSEQSKMFEKGDVFLLDRGFRDSIEPLKNLEFIPKMPQFIKKPDKQLSWFDANSSRLVTKCRYAVEVINGRLKQVFRYFDKGWQNKSLPHFMTDFRNAAAILNAYFIRLESDIDDSEDIAHLMLSRLNEPNKLAEIVINNNLNRKSVIFVSITSACVTFPALSELDLKRIALGTYQIKQAKSYYAEHISPDGKYIIEVCKDVQPFLCATISANEPSLIRGRIQSRHYSNTKYLLYILIDMALSGSSSIIGYYCQCKNGQRTVGTCAHIMAVLWYLGFAKNNNNIKNPAAFLQNIFEVLVESSEDDSDNEDE